MIARDELQAKHIAIHNQRCLQVIAKAREVNAMLLSLNGDFANIVTIRLKTTKQLSRFRCATFGNFLICLRDCRLTCI